MSEDGPFMINRVYDKWSRTVPSSRFRERPHLFHPVIANEVFPFFSFSSSFLTFLHPRAHERAPVHPPPPARLSLHSSPPTPSAVVVALLDDDATYAVCAHPASTAPYDTTVPTRDTTLATSSRRLKSSAQGRENERLRLNVHTQIMFVAIRSCCVRLL